MSKIIPTIAAALLMTAAATPVFAWEAVQHPGVYSFYHPDEDVLNPGRPLARPYDANAYYGGVVTRDVQPRNGAVVTKHQRKR